MTAAVLERPPAPAEDARAAVHAAIRACTACPLSETRQNAVPGAGPLSARIVIVGDVPGPLEDERGLPFVGSSGKQLDELLTEAGIKRSDVYVMNAVRCRPVKEDRDGTLRQGKPTIKTIRACKEHLLAELALLDPSVILLMGDPALKTLLGEDGITKLRGDVLLRELPTRSGLRPVKVIATFHPSSVHYDPGKRPTILLDLRRVAAEVGSRKSVEATETEVFVCRTVDDVRGLVDLMLGQRIVAFDTETTAPGRGMALDSRYYDTLCLSFTFNHGEGWVVPIREQLLGDAVPKKVRTRTVDEKGKGHWSEGYVLHEVLRIEPKTGFYEDADLPCSFSPTDLAQVLAELQRFFTNPRVKKVAHNAKYDMGVVRRLLGVDIQGMTDDTLLMHAVVRENEPHKLDHLRVHYTDLPRYEAWKDDKDILPASDYPYAVVPADIRNQYAGADTDVTWRSMALLRKELAREGRGAVGIYREISIPMTHALYRIERNGVLVDTDRMTTVQGVYNRWIAEGEQALYDTVGRQFAYGSDDQKADLLFSELGLPVLKRTPTGKPATDKDTLTELFAETEHPVLRQLMRLQRLQHQRNTYLCGDDGVSGLRRWLDGAGYIHTTFNQTPRTGRLSSTKPNLQNITKNDAAKEFVVDDDEENPEDLVIRSIFRAPDGYFMVEQDYSQLELRIQGNVCHEPVLLDAFAAGEADIHTITATGIYKVAFEAVTKDQRAIGKRANFAQGYGGGKKAVHRATKLPLEECQQIVNAYKETYAATERFRDVIARLLYKQGYVENAFGRRRHFPTYRAAKDASRRSGSEGSMAWREASKMERQAYNFIIQSDGSDILSLDTIELVLHNRELREMGAIPCLTLHDALYWYVPVACIEQFLDVTHRIMESAALERGLNWWLPVDSEWGYRWGEAIGHRKGLRTAA